VLEEALPRLARVRAWALELHRVPGRPLQAALGALMAHGYRVYAAAPRAAGRIGLGEHRDPGDARLVAGPAGEDALPTAASSRCCTCSRCDARAA
jgi:hypothetical protein